MIRQRPGQRPGRLDHIDSQGLLGVIRTPPIDDLATEANLLSTEADWICIEYKHDPRVTESWQDRRRTTKSQHGALADRVIFHWLVAIPPGLRQRFGEPLDLFDKGRRRDTPSQQREPLTLVLALAIKPRPERRLERAPGLNPVAAVRRTRAVRVV